MAAAHAAEPVYPVAAYAADELNAVRQWEKTWAGKKIDKHTVGQVAEFLPESYVGIYRNPAKWGAPPEGLYFYVVPYQQVLPTSGMIAATKKYAPHVTTGQDGMIQNYAGIAGMPFPQPRTGREVASNFEFNNHGDSAYYKRYAPNVNPKSRTERLSVQENWELFFIHRTEIDPRPALTDNPKGIHRGNFLHMHKPAEMINTRYYSLRYIDPQMEDIMYLWYSQFRRIRRMSTSQRTDAIDGTDLIYDDEFLWDGHMSRNTYELQGTKELLCSRHQDMQKTTRQPGQAIVNGLTLERTKTHVVAVHSKDPHYIYKKRIWYVDPESYIILWSEMYDQFDRYWKCFMQNTCPVPTETGEQKHFIVGTQFIDFQREHAGLSSQTIKRVSYNLGRRMFTLGNLQSTY
ncbi:DUF1329 domain-containing protein [Thermodesulfobacteriota bacterium]